MRDINFYRNSEGKIWLNVASSTQVLENYVNLDNHIFIHFLGIHRVFKNIVPKQYWDLIDKYREARQKALLIRHDCRKPLFFPDASVDHILCSHFLEHVFLVEMENIIRDFFRALKPNGTLHVIVPDIKAQAEQYLTDNGNGKPLSSDEFIRATLLSRESRGSLKYRLLEFGGAFGLQHRWMYDSLSMADKLRDAGFKILEDNETPSKRYRLNDGSVHLVAFKQ